MGLLVGLVSPEAAWARLDETYGNVDLQVFAALKRLRAFKPSKSAVQGQVVELAIAVQRCLTVLRALSREQDFLFDRDPGGGDRRVACGFSTTLVPSKRREERDSAREGD